MDGRFKASETFEYQDEVGEIVLRVCKVRKILMTSLLLNRPNVL